jgi:CDP-diacylglycerol--glycerol-3-phosphate 3-phosphatidyltransferase
MNEVPLGLRRRWWLTALAVVLATAFLVARVTGAFDARTAATWLLAAAVPTGYTLWFLRRSLDLNHRPERGPVTDGGARVHRTLGLANGLTVTRGWLYASVAGFLLVVPPPGSAWRWVPVLFYGTGVLLDRLDGVVARTLGRRTVLGERLDLAFDTLGFLVAPLVGVVWGQLPVWYLSISAARYLFRLGCWTRRRRGHPVGELPESRVRRPLAALQMVVVTVALLPVAPATLVRPTATVAMLPSLAVFLRDYLAVTGRFAEAKANAVPDPQGET